MQEKMTEDELNALLDRWEAPLAPASLRSSVFPRRYWTASIRVPIPALAFMLLLLVAWEAARSIPHEPPHSTLANLQPVSEITIKVITRSGHVRN